MPRRLSRTPKSPRSNGYRIEPPGTPPTSRTYSPLSLWHQFQSDLHSPGALQDSTTESISNFLTVPLEIERFLLFGFAVCLDSFLAVFTMLPIRITLAIYHVIRQRALTPFQKVDLIKGLLIFVACVALDQVDASQLYHLIRGQTILKLYVIFNVLEICEKLCCAFGQDCLSSLFATFNGKSTNMQRMTRLSLFLVSLFYVVIHTLVLFYQTSSLNVAINSHSSALFTLLLSNQFLEIKSSVFKRFERGNLFQLACGDIVERFQLSLFLGIILARNCLEILGTDGMLLIFKSVANVANYMSLFTWFDTKVSLQNIQASNALAVFSILLGPLAMVVIIEVMIDWMKHAFITKFNGISATVYRDFSSSFARDILGLSADSNSEPHRDRTPYLAKRIGFVEIPLACLVVRVAIQATVSVLKGTASKGNLESGDLKLDKDAVGTWKLPSALLQWLKFNHQSSPQANPWQLVLLSMPVFFMYF